MGDKRCTQHEEMPEELPIGGPRTKKITGPHNDIASLEPNHSYEN